MSKKKDMFKSDMQLHILLRTMIAHAYIRNAIVKLQV